MPKNKTKSIVCDWIKQVLATQITDEDCPNIISISYEELLLLLLNITEAEEDE